MILLTPGPCMTSEAVRQAAALPDLNHREPEFLALFQEVGNQLGTLYPNNGWHTYLIGGSGTAAMEAMVTSCVGKGPSLVLENGYYSARLRELFEANRMPCDTLAFDWLEQINPVAVEKKLKNGGYEAVFMAHHETTSGILNPIEEIGEVCRRYGAKLFVDAMSSFGVEEIPFGSIEGLCSTANKCLHGIPGVSFVMLSPEIAERLTSFPRRNYYLSLRLYAGEQPPLTPPVPALRALHEALKTDLASKQEKYRRQSAYLREQLESLGFDLPIPASEAASSLVMASLPGMTYPEWFEKNYQNGFVTYGCKGSFADHYFQVSNMGEVTDAQLEQWISVVTGLVKS